MSKTKQEQKYPKTPDPLINYFVGCDTAGDACIYGQVLNKAGNHQRYLSEEEMLAVAYKLTCLHSNQTVSCAKCGNPVLKNEAIEDKGTGEESGRIFYYCSEHCFETH